MKKSLLLGGLLAATLAPFGVRPVLAHEAPCPFCDMAVTQDTPTQDNETALKIGRKRVEYKCVFCALSEAQTEYQGDLTILAPSEKKGEPISLIRKAEKWSVLPETAFFVAREPLKHKVCNLQARSFTTKEAAQSYIDANPEQLKGASPLTLEQLEKQASAGQKTKAPTNHQNPAN